MPCSKSYRQKYRNRPGPQYPANDCKNMRKKGNDGNYYISAPNKNGIFRWVKLETINKGKGSGNLKQKRSRRKSRSKKRSRRKSKSK